MGHKTEDTVMILGGALLGAAALYLLDPATGQRRRRRLAGAADEALQAARNSVASHWDDAAGRAREIARHVSDETAGWQDSANASAHGVANRARAIAHALSEHAHQHASTLRDIGRKVWKRARNIRGQVSHLPESIAHQAGHVQDEVGDWWTRHEKDARRRAGSWLGYKEGLRTATVTSTAIGCCAVGAGLMYFLDPKQGRARRAWIGDKTASCVHHTGKIMRETGRELAHQCRRLMGKTRSVAERMGGTLYVDSEILVQRIRSQIGHLSPHFNTMQLMADREGTVTLTGKIAAHELDSLLTLIHRIPGVNHVVNRLNVGGQEREPDSEVRVPESVNAHG